VALRRILVKQSLVLHTVAIIFLIDMSIMRIKSIAILKCMEDTLSKVL